MGFLQALSETRAIQAEVPTKLVGNLSHSLCWKAFPRPLSEGYTIHNLAYGAYQKVRKLKEKDLEVIADLDAVGAARRRVASAVSEKTGMHTIGLKGTLSLLENFR
jgi:hypothetical protein